MLPRSEGLSAVAGLFPAVGRDLHHGVLTADAAPELGRQGLLMIGIYAAIPNASACGNDPDRPQLRQARTSAMALAACVDDAAVGLDRHADAGHPGRSILELSIAPFGISAATPSSSPPIAAYLSEAAAAGGIALISSLGISARSSARHSTTFIQQTTGSTTYGMYLVMAMYGLAGLSRLAATHVVRATENRRLSRLSDRPHSYSRSSAMA